MKKELVKVRIVTNSRDDTVMTLLIFHNEIVNITDNKGTTYTIQEARDLKPTS